MSKYAVNSFLEMLYKSALPKETVNTDLVRRRDEMRSKTRALLRIDDLYALADKDPMPTKVGSFESFGVDIDKYEMAAAAELLVPVYVLRPKNPNGRAVLYLHGHDSFGIMGALTQCEESPYHKFMPIKLAQRGYTVYAPELFGFGEAYLADYPAGTGGTGGCSPISDWLFDCGFSMAGVRVFEALRTADFMESQGTSRCAVAGISGGGLVTTFTAALDDRLAAVVCSGYPNLYKTSTLAMDHCVDNFVPGMLTIGESPDVLGLAAPKPLLAINGDKDPIFPIDGSKAAFARLSEIYAAFGAGGALECVLFDGVHEFDVERVSEWLDRTEW
jgi:dienelactone hydrolase